MFCESFLITAIYRPCWPGRSSASPRLTYPLSSFTLVAAFKRRVLPLFADLQMCAFIRIMSSSSAGSDANASSSNQCVIRMAGFANESPFS